ncbi:MAG: 3-deoxy-7-phosphoheptulonate synthase [Melioribacteraceae bacterium]|nr:3-deoxy-7-phosphoheptulonate synthase [Melioribacteraceae bacterium]
MKIKICGITNIEDALFSSNAGADALGFIFYKKSKRFVEYEKAKEIIALLPERIIKIGVFVNEDNDFINKISAEIGLNEIQLHGDESQADASKIKLPVIKAFRVDDEFDYSVLDEFKDYSILLDSKSNAEYGGTGLTFNWELIPKVLKKNIILAGGISINNIEKVYKNITPYMVDLSSSLESEPGKKDHYKIEQFFTKVNGLANMLILMKHESSREAIEFVKARIIDHGCIPHEILGELNIAIGITGPTNVLREEDFIFLEEVNDVIRLTKKYKLVSRQMKSEDTVIFVDGKLVGTRELTIIAGPCSVESKDKVFEIAELLAESGIQFFRAGAYKPRSSPYYFQGLKDEGLQYLDDVKKQFGLKIVTEVLNQKTIGSVAEVADILQIGARNMQNFSLLEDVGKTGKPVLLKRGISASVEDLLLSAEYIAAQQNMNIILCERGIRTFETSSRNTLDLNSVPVIKKNTHLPIIVDPSHGCGISENVPNMALASIAAGAHGLLVEVHQNPNEAYSDGQQSLSMESFKELLKKIKQLAPIVDKEFS